MEIIIKQDTKSNLKKALSFVTEIQKKLLKTSWRNKLMKSKKNKTVKKIKSRESLKLQDTLKQRSRKLMLCTKTHSQKFRVNLV